MIIIKELVSGKKKFYAKSIVDSDGAESVEFAEYRMTKVEKEGFVYFILYDDEMAVIRPFFRYINYEMAHLSYNTREQSAHALRLLYCYLKLTKSDINRLARKDIISLQYFLLGYSPAKGAYSFRLFTVRRNNTVNDYIGIYRSYFKYAGITCKYIEASRSIEYQSINEIGDITSSKEGWTELKLSDFTDVVMGQSPKSEYYNLENIGLPFHQGVGSYGNRFVVDTTYSTSYTRIAEANSILFSVRAPVGRLNITKNRVVIGRGLAAMNHKNGLQHYLYYLLKERFFKDDIVGNGSIFASITKDELLSQRFLIPSNNCAEKYNEIVHTMDEKIAVLDSQITNLTEARDRLLPKLMSGEIEV